MTRSPHEDLVRGYQADRRADAQRWAQARGARAARPAGPATPRPARVRTALAGALHAAARRLEPGNPAAC
jgi:hypothetical protein